MLSLSKSLIHTVEEQQLNVSKSLIHTVEEQQQEVQKRDQDSCFLFECMSHVKNDHETEYFFHYNKNGKLLLMIKI